MLDVGRKQKSCKAENIVLPQMENFMNVVLLCIDNNTDNTGEKI